MPNLTGINVKSIVHEDYVATNEKEERKKEREKKKRNAIGG